MPRGSGLFNSPRNLFPQTSFRKLKPSSGRQDGSNSSNNADSSLLSQNLLGYSEDELQEYRAVFYQFFDADRNGSIELHELDAATRHLGIDMTKEELSQIIDEVDQKGTHQIEFDDFCQVMRRLTMKKRSWNEVIKECFTVFDRSESGVVTKKDFCYILREVGDITDPRVIDEIFAEVGVGNEEMNCIQADIDANGLIDFNEFGAMVQNYLLDEDLDPEGATDTQDKD